VRSPLIVNYYRLLPQQSAQADPQAWARVFRKALLKFQRAVAARYQEGTLEKLLGAPEVEVRQAAVLALGILGTMQVNAALAARLRDQDAEVRELAADALWSLWFRAGTPEHNRELQRLMQLEVTGGDAKKILSGFEALLGKAPRFAEAFNQRAIVYFRLGDYARSIADCDRVLRLNPYHFGAASGMGQCFLKQEKFRAALRAYRRAHRINPNLEGVRETIASLEQMLGDEGKR
jgi:tetratricopeptide (TPR) repeat protein